MVNHEFGAGATGKGASRTRRDGPMGRHRYFEDFAAGQEIPLGPRTVTAGEIVEFARDFDPAPYHLSEEGGKASLLGGLAASGWHSCALLMDMMCDAFLVPSSSQGTPGIDSCRWLRPVLAGDTLSGTATVRSVRRSASRPSIGFVAFAFAMRNGRGETVMEAENSLMFGLRDATAGSAS
jgi:acyl dehydratase